MKNLPHLLIAVELVIVAIAFAVSAIFKLPLEFTLHYALTAVIGAIFMVLAVLFFGQPDRS